DVAKERYITARRIAYAPSKLLMSERARDAQPSPAASGENSLLVRIFDRYAVLVARIAGDANRIASPPLTARYVRTWATIGLGTHFALLYSAAAISYVWPPALLVCLLVFAGVMNV